MKTVKIYSLWFVANRDRCLKCRKYCDVETYVRCEPTDFHIDNYFSREDALEVIKYLEDRVDENGQIHIRSAFENEYNPTCYQSLDFDMNEGELEIFEEFFQFTTI